MTAFRGAVMLFIGQKAPSAKRCIKTWYSAACMASADASESTERQKAH